MAKKIVYFKLVTILMSICMFFISVLIPLKSVSAEVINREKYEIAWAYSPQYGKEVRTELLKNASGQIAYCLVYGLKSPSGEDLSEIGRTDDVVYRVLLNGYPQKTPEQLGVSTWKQAHYATQLSVWVALGQLDPDDLQFKDAEVENAVKAIRYAADHTEETQDVYMNVQPTDKQEAMLNGEYFETTTYRVESNVKKGEFKIQLNQQAPAGTRIVTEQGEGKELFSLGETFRVQVPKASKSSELSLKVTANLTNQQAVVYRGTDTIQDATVLLEHSQEKVSQDLQVFWKSVGGLKILKVDGNKKPLTGAVFEVLTSDQKSIGTITTNTDGIAMMENIEIGSYLVKEVKSPTGYILNGAPQTVEVKTGEIATITAENQPIHGELELTKVDVADGNVKLPNAEFEIRNEKGEIVVKGKTDEKGIAKFKLGYGKYAYKETVSPDGYMLNEETFSFEIKQNGEVVKHTVADEKIPSVQTTATDKTDGTKEMHTSKSVTIQDKVAYKDLQVGKEYTLKGKLMDKDSNQPLVVNGKEITAEATFTAKEANGSTTLDFTFDATGLEGKEVVAFEELWRDGKMVTLHADINDKGQTVKFVKPSVQTTATNKADGSKELEAKNFVVIQDKVAYKDLIVGKAYVVKGKLMDKSTNQPFVVEGKEVTAEHTFTAKEKDGFVTVDFTLYASALEGKEVVVFEDVYQNDVLVATHSDIQDKGQTVTFKNRPVQPKPEQPQKSSKTRDVPVQPEQPKVEQPAKAQPKKGEGRLPTTGGQEENTYWTWVGGVILLVSGMIAYYVYRTRNKISE